jgi:HEAT repeat protein
MADKEPQVRAEAAAALAQCESNASRDALERALTDRSPMVRESARASLDERAAFVRWRAAVIDPSN